MHAEGPEEPHSLNARTWFYVAATLALIAAIPFCWWLADQRLIPWAEEARWMALRRAPPTDVSYIAPTDFIEIDRGLCFGTCPIFRLRLFADGRVEYRGEQYVCEIGNRETRVESGPAARLISDLASAGFFELNWPVQYTVSDSATVWLRLQIGDRTHQVEHYLGDETAPRMLRDMERSIEEVAGAKRWLPRIEGRERVCVTEDGVRRRVNEMQLTSQVQPVSLADSV